MNDRADRMAQGRAEMVEKQLRARGIRDCRVLQVMGRMPRERFLSKEQAMEAYADGALPVGEGQTISQPFIVAAMSEALGVEAGMRVLELGTGTGYQTAILAELARPGLVWTIERFAELSHLAEDRLRELGIGNVRFRVGDGTLGWTGLEFERVMLTAATPEVPGPVAAQLVEGGVLVAPIGGKGSQVLMRLVKRCGRLEGEGLMECRFVPLVGRWGMVG